MRRLQPQIIFLFFFMSSKNKTLENIHSASAKFKSWRFPARFLLIFYFSTQLLILTVLTQYFCTPKAGEAAWCHDIPTQSKYPVLCTWKSRLKQSVCARYSKIRLHMNLTASNNVLAYADAQAKGIFFHYQQLVRQDIPASRDIKGYSEKVFLEWQYASFCLWS